MEKMSSLDEELDDELIDRIFVEEETDSLNDIEEPTDEDLNNIENEIDNVIKNDSIITQNEEVVEIKRKRGRPKKSKIVSEEKNKIEDKVEKVENNKNEENKNNIDWGVKLLTSGSNDLTINEFGLQTYKYSHVLNPEGEQSGYYSCHCYQNGEKKTVKNYADEDIEINVWRTSPRILSKHYVAGNMSSLTAKLDKLFNLKNTKVVSTKPFVISWKGEMQKELKHFDNEGHKIVFEIMTGIESKEIENVKNSTDVFVLNSYGGTSSAYLDFVVNMSFVDNSGNKVSTIDYFTLSKFGYRLLHRGMNFNEMTEKCFNNLDNVSKEVEILKSYNPNEEELKNITIKMKENFRNQFNLLWNERVPINHRDLYHALLLLSVLLHQNYNAQNHFVLRTAIEAVVNKAHKQYEKNEKKHETKSE
jgi:hypothetical protein